MCKKCICLISLVFLLSMTVGAFAADVQWDNSGGDRLWRTATNWDLNYVPTSADKAAIRNASVLGPIIDSSTTAVVAQVVLGDWSSTNDTLTMTGGSLTTSSWFVLGYSTSNNGTLTMSAGTINCPSTLYVGNSGRGTIQITGGTITATTFGIAQLTGSVGDVFLDGGTITCGTFSITTSGGAMDITQGTLIVDGDVTSAINGYITSGQLTGYSGSGTLNVDYNIRNPGKTTVTAQSPEKASYPTPANGATGISINADLSWITGKYATSHDVYFGTTSPGTFRGNQTAVTFDPGTLVLNTTYYWRIDEVNSTNPNSPWIGDVWSFTTQTGTATLKKGPYLIYPGNNVQMTVLWQLSASETCSIAWGTDTSYSTGSANVPVYGTDYQYKYNITNLTPGTKYYYKVTVGAGITTGSFRAAPAASATNVKFFMYGDTRTNGGSNNSLCAQMISTYTADPNYQTMVLHAADWVEGDTEAYWTSQWYNYTWTSLMTAPANMPFMGTIGNHEGSGNCPVFEKYRPFPFVAAPADYFSFDYGPVHVAVVDQYTAYTSGNPQYTWLVNDLSTSTKPWKIIVLHEPGWSAWGSGAHANNATVQSTIQPLCVTYGVQIVLAGHNHFYSRCLVSGIQHVTSGAGGAPYYGMDLTKEYVVTGTANTLEFCKVDIQGDTLTYTTVSNSGAVLDTFTLGGTLPPPGKATSPSPANGAANVATNATLSWTAGSDATSRDVYFGTTSPGTFKGNQTATTYNPGTLNGNTVYYWRIDEKNATGTTTGDVWSFTTATPPLFSDGFESGNFTAGGWTTQNGNATVATAAKYTGVYGAKLAGTTWMQKAVSTVGKSTIHVKYARKTKGLDAGEYLYVEWSIDGSAWNNLETTQATTWASQDFTCGSGANNNANFRVRWRTNASAASSEYAYVDDVVITGQ